MLGIIEEMGEKRNPHTISGSKILREEIISETKV
jgi:hypothetical protein